MANPITWRNVSTPDFGSSLNAISNAGNTILGGLNALKNTAAQYGQQQDRIASDLTKSNTDALLGRISGISDLDQYAQMQKEGAFSVDQLAGQNVDQNAVLKAFADRDNTLRTDLQQEQSFNAQQQELKFKPIRDEIALKIAQGDLVGAEKLATKSGLPDAGQQLTTIQAAIEQQRLKDQKTFVGDTLQDFLGVTNESNFSDASRQMINLMRDQGIEEGVIESSVNNLKSSLDLGNGLRTAQADRQAAASDQAINVALQRAKEDYLTNSSDVKLNDKFNEEQRSQTKEDARKAVQEFAPGGVEWGFGTSKDSLGKEVNKLLDNKYVKYTYDSLSGEITGVEPAGKNDSGAMTIEPYQVISALSGSSQDTLFGKNTVAQGDFYKNLSNILANDENALRAERVKAMKANFRNIEDQAAASKNQPGGYELLMQQLQQLQNN